eukprot:8743994-Pyramimonas_sp.AAC.1
MGTAKSSSGAQGCVQLPACEPSGSLGSRMGRPLSKRPEKNMREWHGGVDAKLGHPIWGCKITAPQ